MQQKKLNQNTIEQLDIFNTQLVKLEKKYTRLLKKKLKSF